MAPLDLFDQVENEHETNSIDPQHASFNFNQTYAQNFERRKRGEELTKLKDKYGSDYQSSDSEEDFSSEDSDAEFITPEVDAAILKTLARIKKQDPKLLESQANIFEEEETQNAKVRAQKSKRDRTNQSSHGQKSMNLRDYHRQALLKNQLDLSDQDEIPSEHYQPTPAEEAAALREETKRAFHAMGDDDHENHSSSDDVQNLLVLRDEQGGESEREEDEYQQFLIEQVGTDDIQTALRLNLDNQKEISPKENQSTHDPRADDEFLRSYVLGRGWIDREAKKIPKYQQIVRSNTQATQSNRSKSNPVLGRTVICDEHDEEDEEFVEKAEEFEADYNFRFENDPTVVTHARDTGPSARRMDESRKHAREALKARKDEEKRERMDELRRIQELKKAEIIEKLEIIRKNAGAEDCNLDDLGLDSDFDPENHDRQMSRAFDNGFYSKTDPEGKPVWEDEIDIDDIIQGRVDEEEKQEVNFEPGGDAYDPLLPKVKLSKKKRQLMKRVGKPPDLNPNLDIAIQEESKKEPEMIELEGLSPKSRRNKLMQALDEYHDLDFEDMIGDMPTRFKYTNTEATDWMTTEQILLATDVELNQVIGLKKLAPYRSLTNDKKLENRKKKLKELRKKLKTRKWGETSDDIRHNNHHNGSQPIINLQQQQEEDLHELPPIKRPRQGKKERKRMKQVQQQPVTTELDQPQ